MTDSSLFILLHLAGMIYSSSFIPTLPIQPLNWNILASTFFPDHCVIPLSSNLTQSWLSILSRYKTIPFLMMRVSGQMG